MKCHLWYLAEEMIPEVVSLLMVPSTETQPLATNKLLAVKQDETMITPIIEHCVSR